MRASHEERPVRWLIDGYLEWVRTERVALVDSDVVDLVNVPTDPWDRMGVRAVFVHTRARGDLCSLYVLEIPPGAETRKVQHLYEAAYFILAGTGETAVDGPEGDAHSFAWVRGSLFALPLNAPYTLRNLSETASARVAVVTNLPMVMKQFRDANFVFGTEAVFPERWGADPTFTGDGRLTRTREQRHVWEASLVHDVMTFEHLLPSPSRGHGSSNIQFILGESTMHAHLSAVGPASFKKAHAHEAGAHIIQLSEGGYTRYWIAGEEPRRVDWHFGTLHSPAENEWHQHFNTSDSQGKYMPVWYGGYRYPFTEANRQNVLHSYAVKSPIQIEPEDQDPEVSAEFERERQKWLANHMHRQADR